MKRFNEAMKEDVSGWVMELYPGKYLKKVLEGGDFMDTYEITEAKMVDSEDTLVRLADELYVDFGSVGEGYPKFHKVRLTAEIVDTITYDDIA